MMTVAGKDLLNMDFRIKPRSFAFVGAGTRFKYVRDENGRERITAQGPLNQDVELLVRKQISGCIWSTKNGTGKSDNTF